MTVIVETGAGTPNANSYNAIADITAYLTARNRQTENGWSTASSAEQCAAAIEGSTYLDLRWGSTLRGCKQFTEIAGRIADGEYTLAGVPTASETVTVGQKTYTWVASISSAGDENDVLVGADAAASVVNLIAAVNADASGLGTLYHEDTLQNRDAKAVVNADPTKITFEARYKGLNGNTIATTVSGAGAGAWGAATLLGGLDDGQQLLEFPRLNLVDSSGVCITGLPIGVRYAAIEYTVRAKATGSLLLPDPTADARGGIVSRFRRRTGPLETEIEYLGGSAGSGRFPSYPAADALMRPFVHSSGGVIR